MYYLLGVLPGSTNKFGELIDKALCLHQKQKLSSIDVMVFWICDTIALCYL